MPWRVYLTPSVDRHETSPWRERNTRDLRNHPTRELDGFNPIGIRKILGRQADVMHDVRSAPHLDLPPDFLMIGCGSRKFIAARRNRERISPVRVRGAANLPILMSQKGRSFYPNQGIGNGLPGE